jgi:integrase
VPGRYEHSRDPQLAELLHHVTAEGDPPRAAAHRAGPRHHRRATRPPHGQVAERLAAGPAWPNSRPGLHPPGRHPATTRVRPSAVRPAHPPRRAVADRLHDLRHTHATLALQAGVHPKVVSERLGHATVAMTLDSYSHLIPGLQQDAAATVASLVSDGSLAEQA